MPWCACHTTASSTRTLWPAMQALASKEYYSSRPDIALLLRVQRGHCGNIRRARRASKSVSNYGCVDYPPAAFRFHRYVPLHLSAIDHGPGAAAGSAQDHGRSEEEHTSELQSLRHLVCR